MSIYEIRVQGRLDQHWAAWFEGLTLTYDGDCTLLRGPLADEAALHGVLAKVRNLHVRLLSVNTVTEVILNKAFVLVHGSWQGGWVWQAVKRQLEAQGHQAHAEAGVRPVEDAVVDHDALEERRVGLHLRASTARANGPCPMSLSRVKDGHTEGWCIRCRRTH